MDLGRFLFGGGRDGFVESELVDGGLSFVDHESQLVEEGLFVQHRDALGALVDEVVEELRADCAQLDALLLVAHELQALGEERLVLVEPRFVDPGECEVREEEHEVFDGRGRFAGCGQLGEAVYDFFVRLGERGLPRCARGCLRGKKWAARSAE